MLEIKRANRLSHALVHFVIDRASWNNTFAQQETFSEDDDDDSVWDQVGLILVNFRGRSELTVEIRTRVAQHFFVNLGNLPFCGGSERVPLLSEDLRQILRKITGEWSQRRQLLRHALGNGPCDLTPRKWRTTLWM